MIKGRSSNPTSGHLNSDDGGHHAGPGHRGRRPGRLAPRSDRVVVPRSAYFPPGQTGGAGAANATLSSSSTRRAPPPPRHSVNWGTRGGSASSAFSTNPALREYSNRSTRSSPSTVGQSPTRTRWPSCSRPSTPGRPSQWWFREPASARPSAFSSANRRTPVPVRGSASPYRLGASRRSRSISAWPTRSGAVGRAHVRAWNHRQGRPRQPHQRPLHRRHGRDPPGWHAVAPIGGIQLKMIAARRAGATIFLAPSDNCKDVSGAIPSGSVRREGQQPAPSCARSGQLCRRGKRLHTARASPGWALVSHLECRAPSVFRARSLPQACRWPARAEPALESVR